MTPIAILHPHKSHERALKICHLHQRCGFCSWSLVSSSTCLWLPVIAPSSPARHRPACTGNETVSSTCLIRTASRWSFADYHNVIFYMSFFMRKGEMLTCLISRRRQKAQTGSKIKVLMASLWRRDSGVTLLCATSITLHLLTHTRTQWVQFKSTLIFNLDQTLNELSIYSFRLNDKQKSTVMIRRRREEQSEVQSLAVLDRFIQHDLETDESDF